MGCVESLHKTKMYYTCCCLSSSSDTYVIKDGDEIGLTLLFFVELCVCYCRSISKAAFQAVWLQCWLPLLPLCLLLPVPSLTFTSPEMQLLTHFLTQVLPSPCASTALVCEGCVRKELFGYHGSESCWEGGCHVWNHAEEVMRTGVALSCGR